MTRGPRGRGWLIAALAATALTAPLAACHRAGQPQAASQTALQSQQAEQVLKVLADAPSQGFAPGAFPTTGIEDGLKSRDAATRAAAQGRLVAEILAYARAQHGFAIPKSGMDKNWGMRSQAHYDPTPEFQAAAAQNQLPQWLASLPPPAPQYELLRKGYLTYLKIAEAGGWQPIPPGGDLRPGSRDPRIVALRQRLAFEDASLGQTPANAPYDGALAQAVQRFQHRHGLKETGIADAPTVAALNVPAVARAAQLRANLERWRWAPRDTPATRIEVNSSAGLFDLYVDGQPAMHMLVVAGKPGDETPIVASKIHTVVLNPTWNVPEDIAQNELIPKGEDYLAAHHFTNDGGKLVQQPGPGNALGQVKFLFDNPYSVYLHDTPSRAAFNQTQRSASHGCVRLERAADLAKYLLGHEAGWSPEKVDQTMAGNDTLNVPLKQQVPVRIYYWTAFVEGDQVSFRDDVYGWDAATLRQLDASLASHA
ncbi:L,D-transpeptidase family protein [Phenylobacterium sp.]|uniref:L,D-transpeptidase family protein n=1 Tax=Phenylobacterium sp. TaxID=1871053 RepID=UPI002DE80F1C|nr:L,D-transpeptidase family protein [Phenylobacterium sp.]